QITLSNESFPWGRLGNGHRCSDLRPQTSDLVSRTQEPVVLRGGAGSPRTAHPPLFTLLPCIAFVSEGVYMPLWIAQYSCWQCLSSPNRYILYLKILTRNTPC